MAWQKLHRDERFLDEYVKDVGMNLNQDMD